MVTPSSADSAKKIYESGLQGFLIAPPEGKDGEPLGLVALDFDQILAQKHPRKLIQALPPQLIYHSLLARGVEDCLEVLPHLSPEQFIRICDYDVWHEDRLVPRRLFTWLGYYRELSHKQLYERFRSLDEEYQLAALTPHLRVYSPEEYEKMTDEQRDRLYRLPGDALFYEITSSEKEIHEGIEQLIEATMSEDMNYAIAMLSHSTYQLVGESELALLQFRNARLEEDGFVSYQESMQLFVPQGFEELRKKWQTAASSPASASTALLARDAASSASFLHRVVAYARLSNWTPDHWENLQRSFLYLSNALCTACQIESDDRHGLKRLLEHSQGLCSLSLEALSQGDLEVASKILLTEDPKRLFRAALDLVGQLQQQIIDQLIQANIQGAEQLAKYHRLHKNGALLDHIDRELLEVLGYEKVELLKGLFNRLPLVPVEQPAAASNSGVQRILFVPLQTLSELRRCRDLVKHLTAPHE